MQVGFDLIRLSLMFIIATIRSTHALLESGLGSEDEVRLVEYLFDHQGYNPLIRPVRNLTEKIAVKFGLAMIQLINVDEKNQIMKSNVWLRMLWSDYQLQWEPSEYGGITTIRILPDKVWKPDIVLFNNADGKYEVSYKPNVVIYNSGEVLWIPPAIYKSSCSINVEYFPFDEQDCEMKFGSWTFNGDQVELDWYEGQDKVDLSDYVNSGTWDIIKCPGNYSYTWDSTEMHHTAQITFTLTMRRKTLFYTVNLIIPCVLISFLSVCVFYLPADAGEKMTMCISILLALVVFLLLVSKILPPTSITIPLIAKYLLFTFIMNIFTILITVIIINWNFRTPRTHRMPRWVRVVFLNYLPRILFMKRPNHSERWVKKQYSVNQQAAREAAARRERGEPPLPPTAGGSTAAASGGHASASNDLRQYATANAMGSSGASTANRADLLELSEIHHPNCKFNRKPGGGGSAMGMGDHHHSHMRSSDYDANPDSAAGFHMTPETHKAIEAVRFIAAHLKNEDDYAEILEDWRYIAMVIDRFQLYLFLAVTIGGTIGILINAPHIFEYVDQDAVKAKIMGTTPPG